MAIESTNSVIMPTPVDTDYGAFVINKDGRPTKLSEAFLCQETKTPGETSSASERARIQHEIREAMDVYVRSVSFL